MSDEPERPGLELVRTTPLHPDSNNGARGLVVMSGQGVRAGGVR
jgi:hypothetical protein